MTRSQKINKLGNAIKRLRGLMDMNTGKWRTPPNPAAADDVVRWLQKLREPMARPDLLIQIREDMHDILNFKTVAEYETWIREL